VPTNVLFAGIVTADLSVATTWYEALLGRPADIVVHDTEIMWQISDGGWLYLLQDPTRAGHGLATIAVTDLDEAVADIVARGIERPEIKTVGQGARKALVSDPEGNVVDLIEVVTTTS
jgi:predicted enzyme related to lactoylglutathione lyase